MEFLKKIEGEFTSGEHPYEEGAVKLCSQIRQELAEIVRGGANG